LTIPKTGVCKKCHKQSQMPIQILLGICACCSVLISGRHLSQQQPAMIRAWHMCQKYSMVCKLTKYEGHTHMSDLQCPDHCSLINGLALQAGLQWTWMDAQLWHQWCALTTTVRHFLLSISSLLCSVWYIVGGMPLNGYILCPTHLTVAHQDHGMGNAVHPSHSLGHRPHPKKEVQGIPLPSAFTCMVLTVNQVSVCPMSRVAHGSGTGWQGPTWTRTHKTCTCNTTGTL